MSCTPANLGAKATSTDTKKETKKGVRVDKCRCLSKLIRHCAVSPPPNARCFGLAAPPTSQRRRGPTCRRRRPRCGMAAGHRQQGAALAPATSRGGAWSHGQGGRALMSGRPRRRGCSTGVSFGSGMPRPAAGVGTRRSQMRLVKEERRGRTSPPQKTLRGLRPPPEAKQCRQRASDEEELGKGSAKSGLALPTHETWRWWTIAKADQVALCLVLSDTIGAKISAMLVPSRPLKAVQFARGHAA